MGKEIVPPSAVLSAVLFAESSCRELSLFLSAGVEVRTYKVIYDLVDEMRAAMEGRLSTVEERTYLGKAEVSFCLDVVLPCTLF